MATQPISSTDEPEVARHVVERDVHDGRVDDRHDQAEHDRQRDHRQRRVRLAIGLAFGGRPRRRGRRRSGREHLRLYPPGRAADAAPGFAKPGPDDDDHLGARLGPARPPAGVHGVRRLPQRARLPRAAPQRADAVDAAGDHGRAAGQSARDRAVEPLPARARMGRGPHQPRVRAAVRGDGPLGDRARSVQLQRARHGQHGSVRALRLRRAQGALAAAAARREDPLGFLDDGARGRVVGRDEHQRGDRAQGRRVRDQRAQVVDVGRRATRAARC